MIWAAFVLLLSTLCQARDDTKPVIQTMERAMNTYLQEDTAIRLRLLRFRSTLSRTPISGQDVDENHMLTTLEWYYWVRRKQELTELVARAHAALGVLDMLSSLYSAQIDHFCLRTFRSAEGQSDVAANVLRIQKVYDLAADDPLLGGGNLPLDANDLFYLGQQAYQNDLDAQSLQWMGLARSATQPLWEDIDNETSRCETKEQSQGEGGDPDSGNQYCKSQLSIKRVTALAMLDFTAAEVYDHLSFVSARMGSLEDAVNYGKEFIKHDPSNSRAQRNLALWTNALATDFVEIGGNHNENEVHSRTAPGSDEASLDEVSFPVDSTSIDGDQVVLLSENSEPGSEANTSVLDDGEGSINDHKTSEELLNEEEDKQSMAAYHRLCSQALQVARSQIQPPTRCDEDTVDDPTGSNHNDHSPQRLQLISEDPPVYVYKNFLSFKERKELMKLGSKKLRPATAWDGERFRTLELRVSRSAWLDEQDDERDDTTIDVVALVNNRVSSVTGLDLSTADSLQIGYYSPGGHYEPHYDHRHARRVVVNSTKPDRIATFFIYLNHVPQGGATVFTEVNLSFSPTPGDALFWYNLVPLSILLPDSLPPLSSSLQNNELPTPTSSLELLGHPGTRHGSCPVVVGEKWVANKWIRQSLANDEALRRTFGVFNDNNMKN